MIIRLAYLLCLAFGHNCVLGIAHTSHYVPSLGGINCSEPCDQDAAGRPVQYGWTAACDPRVFNSRVYLEGIGWRGCWDTGGQIHEFDVDVAIPQDQCEWRPYIWEGEERLWCAHRYSGERLALWVATPPIEGDKVMQKQWKAFRTWSAWARKQPRHWAALRRE